MTTWPWIWTWEIPPYHTGGVKKKVFTNFLQNGRHWLCMLTWKKEKIMKINFETPYQIYVYLSIYLSIYLLIDALLKSILSLTFKCHVYHGPRTLGQNLKCFKTISSFSLKPSFHRVQEIRSTQLHFPNFTILV